MKKRLLALLVASVLSCTATVYADQPLPEAASVVTESSDEESADSLTEDEAAAFDVSAEEVPDESEDNGEEDAPSVMAETEDGAISSDGSIGQEAAESDAALSENVMETELTGDSMLPAEDAKIETGIYYLTAKADETYVIGTAGKSDKIRANIELQTRDDSVAQRFVITSLGGGLYSIWNYDSGLALDVRGSSSDAGSNMQSYWRNTSTGEKFYLLDAGDGSVVIKPLCTSCAVEFEGGTAADGINVRTNTYEGTDNQKFVLTKADDAEITGGTYVIHTKLDDSKTLYVAGASKADGANIEIRAANRAAASQITLFARSDGTFILSPVSSGHAIETKSKGSVNRENVQQGKMSTKSTQRWKLVSDGNGYYYIVMADRNRCLTVAGNATANGTNVYIYDTKNTANRLFSLERIDGKRTVPNGTYSFTNLKNTKLHLEVAGGSKADRGNIQVATAADVNRQKFKVAYESDGYYRISNINSGKYLHVNTGKPAIGQNIMQYKKLVTNAQSFTLTEYNGTGTYTMITKLGDYTIGTNNKKVSGSNVQLSEHKNWLHERWDLTPASASKTYLVAIDAGHQRYQNTGKEPNGPGSSVYKQKVSSGTYGPWSKLNEYELNLQVSLKLQTELEARGYDVYMIRTTHDVNISNAERATMAANAGAYIFVRIHANGDDSSSINGALCYMPSSSNRFLTASVISGSQKLSRCVINSYCAATGLRNLGILEGDDMTGINWAKMPVTIVEMGFMSNRSDDLFMASAAGQAKIVTGIANGIDQYFNS